MQTIMACLTCDSADVETGGNGIGNGSVEGVAPKEIVVVGVMTGKQHQVSSRLD